MSRLGWRASWVAVTVIPAVFLVLFFAWPTAALVLRGFHDGSSWRFTPLAEVLAAPRTWRATGFTLASAMGATTISVILGLPGAYLLYRLRFPGRDLLRAAVSVPFVLPTVVVGVAFGSLLRPGGLLDWLNLSGTPTAIVAAMVFFNYSVVVRTVGVFWARIDPRLTQAAATLGASPIRCLVTVTLPALAPAVLSAASLVFLFSASSYGIVMVLGQGRFHTIETEIWFLTTQVLDLRSAAALSVTQLVIITVALWLSGRTQASMTRALRLQPTASTGLAPLLRRDWPAVAVTLTVITLLLGLPLTSLVWRSLHRGGEPSPVNYVQLSISGGLGTSVWDALNASLSTAMAATVIAVTLGLLVALVASRRPRGKAARSTLHLVEGLFLLPLGVSAVTVGFGYLITLNRPPLDLRSSMVLIPIAQAVVALPLVVRTLLATLRAIDPHQLEAAATLGSSPWVVLWRIELPHLGRALGLAVGFALATSLGEFGATSFLARPDTPTLPVLIFRLFGRPGAENLGLALASSVVLAGLAGVTMAVAERIRPREVST